MLSNDVLFVPALDGKLRALDRRNGMLLWQYNTMRPFETVNRVKAHGGAMDNVPVLVAGPMLYAQSGYSLFGQLPGNVLLAFELAVPESD